MAGVSGAPREDNKEFNKPLSDVTSHQSLEAAEESGDTILVLK
jgi:hypothetical protein